MDISTVTLSSIDQSNAANQSPDDVQLTVLKKAEDMQSQGLSTLLQSVTGPLPLATSGSLGTQLNVRV